MPPSGDWRAAVSAIAGARVVMVIGESDAGKTTLVTALASELAARGWRVGVVDSDVGQSEIGPPTTVGLGLVSGGIGRLSEAATIALQFVGVTSPARDVGGVVDATVRMVRRARGEGMDPVLVDTGGLVLGWPGHRLKGRKIDAVDPDVLLVLERAGECEPIVARYAGRSRPRVLRMAARGRVGSRSQIVRRQRRVQVLDGYLRDALRVTFRRSAIALETPPGLEVVETAGALCGLDDGDGNTIAVGVIEQVTGDGVRVLAPLPPGAVVHRIRIGRELKDGTPLAPAPEGRGRDGAA